MWNYVVLVFVVTLYTSFCFSATYGRVILTSLRSDPGKASAA